MKKSLIYLVALLFVSTDVVINKAVGCIVNITIKDGPVIEVSENQTLLPVTFLRTGNTSIAVTINATTHSDTAISGSDFISPVEDIQFDARVNSSTANFTIVDNMRLENLIERFFINITTTDTNVCSPYDSVIIQIKDDDKAEIGFHREFINVSENVGNVSIKFYKSPRIEGAEIPLTARYFTQGIGNATINIDYQNVSKYITFTPLQYTNEQHDAVEIINNDIVENTKCFNMSLDATHPNVLFSRPAMICILNDDKVTIEFLYSNMSVEEDLGIISVPVIKTGKSAIPISVRMTMKEDFNTAIKNVDYEDRDGQIITFQKDVSKYLFNVTIKNDGDFESTESFFIGIEALDTSTTTIGSKNLAVIRIIDRIDNEINQEKQRQTEEEQKRRTVLMSYLLYVIVAVLIIMIIIFIALIVMIIKKLKKYSKV